ncbi:DUF397 domain-containing protein [Kitasatospora sp. NPDC101447]|uniref:DUF397 domain-containing protein n=1 Tax=Kitasatospora sp. NPDC101447 TaxID=3364102 RepID=UPI0038076E5F
MLASELGDVVWRKSGYSGQGGDCVEVAELAPGAASEVDWQRSSYSAVNECVETRFVTSGGMAVRDSKDPEGPALPFPADAWSSFLAGVKSGEFPTD